METILATVANFIKNYNLLLIEAKANNIADGAVYKTASKGFYPYATAFITDAQKFVFDQMQFETMLMHYAISISRINCYSLDEYKFKNSLMDLIDEVSEEYEMIINA